LTLKVGKLHAQINWLKNYTHDAEIHLINYTSLRVNGLLQLHIIIRFSLVKHIIVIYFYLLCYFTGTIMSLKNFTVRYTRYLVSPKLNNSINHILNPITYPRSFWTNVYQFWNLEGRKNLSEPHFTSLNIPELIGSFVRDHLLR